MLTFPHSWSKGCACPHAGHFHRRFTRHCVSSPPRTQASSTADRSVLVGQARWSRLPRHSCRVEATSIRPSHCVGIAWIGSNDARCHVRSTRCSSTITTATRTICTTTSPKRTEVRARLDERTCDGRDFAMADAGCRSLQPCRRWCETIRWNGKCCARVWKEWNSTTWSYRLDQVHQPIHKTLVCACKSCNNAAIYPCWEFAWDTKRWALFMVPQL